MYPHHAMQMTFTRNYGEYLGKDYDVDGFGNLSFVKRMLQVLFPRWITIGGCAESGVSAFSSGFLGACMLLVDGRGL